MRWYLRDHLAETGIATSTVNRHIFALFSVFSNGSGNLHHLQQAGVPKIPQGREWLTAPVCNDDEYCRLIPYFRETVDDWIADLVIVGCNTGMLDRSIALPAKSDFK